MVRTVLQHKDWRKAMRTTFTTRDKHGSQVPETPLRLLVRVFPDLAELVFDQCVSLEAVKDGSGGGGEAGWVPSSGPPSSAVQFLRSGAVARMDYEFIDDAFNLERKEEKGTGKGKHNVSFCFLLLPLPLFSKSSLDLRLVSDVRALPGGQQ